MAETFEVVYLTGPPATGKSSVSRALPGLVTPLEVFEYGQRLTQHLARSAGGLTQDELRARSGRIATPADIEHVDRSLVEFVAVARRRAHVLVDSHAVTKEDHGFRVTAFDLAGIRELGPTMIVMLYTPPEVTMQRISAAPAGRPAVTAWEAQFHTDLQASVAAAYAVGLGCPLYLVDSSGPLDGVAAEVARLIHARRARA